MNKSLQAFSNGQCSTALFERKEAHEVSPPLPWLSSWGTFLPGSTKVEPAEWWPHWPEEGKNQSPRLLAWVEFVGWGSREEGGRSVCEDTLRVFNPAAGLNMNRAGPCDLEPTPCCGDWEKNSYTKFYLQKQASVCCLLPGVAIFISESRFQSKKH